MGGRAFMPIDEQKKKASKSERNRREYLRSKEERDIVLFRLDPGGREALDRAGKAAGLSRAAFARIYLMPLVGVLAERAPAIEAARRVSGQSLPTFLSRALDQALAPPPSVADHSADMLAQEFQDLFGVR